MTTKRNISVPCASFFCHFEMKGQKFTTKMLKNFIMETKIKQKRQERDLKNTWEWSIELKKAEKQKEMSNDLEENDEDENEYIEDETTNPDEKADFEKHVKEQARKAVSKYNEGSESLAEDKYLDLVNMLNEQQRKIFDDFAERINSGIDDDPFYLYIGGEAGTGKSFVLKSL